MHNDLISVIIPVYKVEQFLTACVDSVLASTYPNLEVILVDDGSPDNCPQICDTYAQQDRRIKVIHQKNQGLCAARNAGLKASCGRYVTFVDSDDMISPLMYEHMLAAMKNENADWVGCEVTRDIDKLYAEPHSPAKTVRVLDTVEQQISVLVCAPQIREITWTNAYVCDKLYRKELIQKPFMVGCLNMEDLQFNWDYLQNSRKLAIVPSALYYYRINETSITETYRKNRTDRVAERSISISNTYERITEQVPPEYPRLIRYMRSRTVNYMHGALFRIHANGLAKGHKDFQKHVSSYIRTHWQTVWLEKETFNLRAKLPVALFKFAYPLWVLATKLIHI